MKDINKISYKEKEINKTINKTRNTFKAFKAVYIFYILQELLSCARAKRHTGTLI